MVPRRVTRSRYYSGETMQEHVHTGFVSFVFAGVSAVIFIQMMRLVAAELVKNPSTEGAGKVIGGLVHFSS